MHSMSADYLVGLTLHAPDTQFMPDAMSHQRVTLDLALEMQRCLANTMSRLVDVEAERDRANSILAALREPSEVVVTAALESNLTPIARVPQPVAVVLRAAVAAVEQEVDRAEAATLEVLSAPAKTEFPPQEHINECGW